MYLESPNPKPKPLSFIQPIIGDCWTALKIRAEEPALAQNNAYFSSSQQQHQPILRCNYRYRVKRIMPFGALKDMVGMVHFMAGWVYVSMASVKVVSPCFKPSSSVPCDAAILSPSSVVAAFPSHYLHRCCVSTLLQSRTYIYMYILVALFLMTFMTSQSSRCLANTHSISP